MTTNEGAKKGTDEKASEAKKLVHEKVSANKPENDSLELSEEELKTVAGAGGDRGGDPSN